MTKPFDVSKYRKSLTKSINGISVGFNDPSVWISTGNKCLNYLISGDFEKGIPLGKVTMLAGESGCLPKAAKVRIRFGTNHTEKEVTVGELYDLWINDERMIEIDSPDGYQPIINWFNKGPLNLVTVKTPSHITTCATTHLIQKSDGEWFYAGALYEGVMIKTESGDEPILSVTIAGIEDCYDFEVFHKNHRYYGDGIVSHNSGKSLIASGNVVKNAQEKGIYVVLMDTENALDSNWLDDLGVDISEDKLLRISVSMVDDVAKIISDFMKQYKADFSDLPREEQPKVLFVIDSLGMLLTPTDQDQFEKGDMKGDMGRKAKALGALVRNCVCIISQYNVGIVATNHVYSSQDMFDPDPKISGGMVPILSASIVIAMRKLKLKEDEEGNKSTDVSGIRAIAKVIKTRFCKPFEQVHIKIPYSKGMDEYSGLFDLFQKLELLTKIGNKYLYISKDSSEHKYFAKEYERNQNGIFDRIIDEFDYDRKKPDEDDSPDLEINETHDIVEEENHGD